MRIFLFSMILLAALNGTAQNQPLSFSVFSTAEGLSNNQVNCTIKDIRGYLWVGTAEGLNRFDGRHFRTFYSERTDTNSLAGNYIFDILENHPGELLIATNNGLSVLNTFTNRFENDRIREPLLKKGHAMIVSNLYKDHENRLWVNYNGIIDIFNDRLSFLYRLTDQSWAASLKGINIYYEKCFTDKSGRIWMASDNEGICIVDEKKQTVYNWKNNPYNYPFLGRKAVRSFYLDTISNKLYYGTWAEGLQCYDFASGKNTEQVFNIYYFTEARCINSISVQNDGNLIAAGGKAIYSVNPATLDYHIQDKINNQSVLPGNFTSISTFNDGIGNLWVGTYSFGLLKIREGISAIDLLELPKQYLLPGYYPFCSAGKQAGDHYYFAYNLDGLFELNLLTREINNYKILSPTGKNLDAFCLCSADSNTLWIGTGLGIYSFQQQTKHIGYPEELPAFTRNMHVSAMAADMEGNQWIAFSDPNAVAVYNKARKQFYYYKDYLVGNQSVFNKAYKITCIKPDSEGNIWMTSGIKGGIACYHSRTGNWEHFPGQGSKNYLLFTENGIADIMPGKQQTLWLAFDPGMGLVKYDYGTDSLIFFEHKNGILSDNINSIDKDNQGNLLLLSNSGINYFNLGTGEIQSRTFTNAEINWSRLNSQFYDDRNDQLLYPVNDKILVIKNDFQKTDTQKIKVYLEDIHPEDQPGYMYTAHEPVSLQHTASNISLSLTVPGFFDNNTISFAYMLKGYDKDWTVSDSTQTISYKNIPPGKYTFLARAKKHSGEWGPVNDYLRVQVLPSFWETWWFRLLSVCLILVIVYGSVQSRIRSIKYKAGIKQKITETEMAALQAQMNPHFIFNCLNAIDNLIQTNQTEKATTYLARFARLIRSVLDGAKNNLVSFQTDLESIKLYLQMEQFRCSNKFTFEMTADDELMHSDIKVPGMLIQPFVENAILHGLLNKQSGERKLTIRVALKNEWIIYSITDNGVGRTRAGEINALNRPEHQSEGIRISKERLQLFNNDKAADAIEIIDLFSAGIPAGTEVIVKVKIPGS